MNYLRGLAMSAFLALPVGASAETTILFNNFIGPNDTLYTQVIRPWLDEIETVTEGRVNFEIPEASLAPPPELLTMVQQGIADGGYIMTGFLEGSNPLLQIAMLPGLNASAESASVAYWRTYQEYFTEADKLEGVELLGLLSVPTGSFYSMTNRSFTSISDFKGAKFWSLPGYSARALSELGAVVSPGPAVRMYEVISGGVVDAYCCINYPSVENFNVKQFTKSVTEMPNGLYAPAFAFYVSSDIWGTISPEDQEAIHKVSGEALARRMSESDALMAEARDRIEADGVTVTPASDEMLTQLYEAWQPIYQTWTDAADTAGVDGKAALDFYREQVAQVAAGN
ncbi:TRAP transporter substrate-binding protein DctP [Paracoccus sp. (in: a-proteobacteria)]|uniref:TRAP transporter substrate-binding protein DctP n=1 Tax=Paracoccus sp. TaxID=267 RepID=UPI003A8BF667